ncbi:MAG: GNAT family N-acetyltransferase [Bacteroidetes bacterium]|nr:MAG: GNAT family N-acetyltransferase [Bacteroidota bacterium]
MVIRKINLQDIEALIEIGIQTFTEAFSSSNSEENMIKYLDSSFSTKKIKAELLDENAEFYFAELDGKIIGYIKINVGPSQTVLQNGDTLEVERIYVLKEYYGKQVGQTLLEKAIDLAKERNVDYVWLAVWEKNPRAIRFYEKNSFVAYDKHIFMLGSDEQTDILMKMKLNNN